jgi:hypothetical protein
MTDYTKLPTNVIRGHKVQRFVFWVIPRRNSSNWSVHEKAAINNPNVSDEAKEHSRQVIEEVSKNDLPKEQELASDDKDETRVLAGYKATMKSGRYVCSIRAHDIDIYVSFCVILDPNVSQEAKDHAREILEEKGEDV